MSVIPVHQIDGNGSFTIDVVLIEGKLLVRVIDYRSMQKGEYYLETEDQYDLIEKFGKTAGKYVLKGFEYCRKIAKILTLKDLSEESKTILGLIPEGEKIDRKELAKKIGKTQKELIDALNPLQLKWMIGMEEYKYIFIEDRLKKLRESFSDEANHRYLN